MVCVCGPCITLLYITGQSIGSASHNTFVLIDGILGTILAGKLFGYGVVLWPDSITDYVDTPHHVYCLSLNPVVCTFCYITLHTAQKRWSLCGCTWWLLGLAVKAPWFGPHGPIFALAAWTGLENATLTL